MRKTVTIHPSILDTCQYCVKTDKIQTAETARKLWICRWFIQQCCKLLWKELQWEITTLSVLKSSLMKTTVKFIH